MVLMGDAHPIAPIARHLLANCSPGARASWMDPEPRFQHENLLGFGLFDHGPL